jgi:hypothetical protein
VKISSRNNFTSINKYKWIVGCTIHLCCNHLLSKFYCIPWYAMNLSRKMIGDEKFILVRTCGIHRIEYASCTFPQFVWLWEIFEGYNGEANKARKRWATRFCPIWGRDACRSDWLIQK